MLSHPKALRVLTIHLSSWRYLAALTLPPIVFVLVSQPSLVVLPLIFLALLVHYFCWRLWLDERLFKLLTDEEGIAVFDTAMAVLWGKPKGKERSLGERWKGAKALLHKALLSTVILWVMWAICWLIV